MVYSDDDDFAQDSNFDSWDEYEASGKYPRKKTLERHRLKANSAINRWIGSWNVDITDPRFIEELKNLELELIKRRHDKEKDRKTREGGGIYTPHDYLYQAERDHLKTIGMVLGYKVPGVVG